MFLIYELYIYVYKSMYIRDHFSVIGIYRIIWFQRLFSKGWTWLDIEICHTKYSGSPNYPIHNLLQQSLYNSNIFVLFHKSTTTGHQVLGTACWTHAKHHLPQMNTLLLPQSETSFSSAKKKCQQHQPQQLKQPPHFAPPVVPQFNFEAAPSVTNERERERESTNSKTATTTENKHPPYFPQSAVVCLCV